MKKRRGLFIKWRWTIIIVINKHNKDLINKLRLHDAEISKIICDYINGTVEMPIIMSEKQRYAALLKFENISNIKVSRKEPWGPGIYVFEVNADDAEGDYFKVDIVLNSGDMICITSSKMIYSLGTAGR